MYNTIIFSINVFEDNVINGRHGNNNLNYYFLKEQILNIKYNTTHFTEVYIILSCNNIIFDRIQNEGLYDEKIKIIINPEIINKKRFKGSITQGIFSNLKYIVEKKINFDYFVIFSSRNILINKINLDIIYNNMIHSKTKWQEISKLNKKFYYNPNYSCYQLCDGSIEPGYLSFKMKNTGKFIEPIPQWYFNDDRVKTKLWFHKFKNEFEFIIGGKHEALCFTNNVIKNMYNYMINNNETMNEIYNAIFCIEEIVPQTLGYHLRNSKDDISFTFLQNSRLFSRDSEKLRIYNKQFKNN